MSTMFLENTLAPVQVKCTLEEAYTMMLEAAQMSEALTEGLYTADYQLHLQESTGALTEEEAEKKKGNFLKNAAVAVKNFIIKCKDAVVAFLTRIGDAIKARIKKLRGPYVKIVKGGLEEIKAFFGVIIEYKSLISAKSKDANEYSEKVEKFLQTTYHPKQKSISDTFAKSKKDGDVEEVKVSDLNNVMAYANKISATAQNAKTELDASVKEVMESAAKADAAAAKMSAEDRGGDAGKAHEEAQKEANEVIKLNRSHAKYYHGFAQATGWFSTLLSKAIVGSTTGTDE